MQLSIIPHVSFSSLKDFKECPHKFKLKHVDGKKKFSSNEFTIFGTAIHESAERKSLDETVDENKVFTEKFEELIAEMVAEKKEVNQKLVTEMKSQGLMLAPKIIPALKEKFGNFKVLRAEEDIMEAISDIDFDIKFKGFIDVIIQTEDGIIHILDYKSTSWGWDMEKKSDPMTTYQLTFYKHFYAIKHNIPVDKIETHFVLLKRTAKKEEVEVFRVTSGKKKTENALKFLKDVIYNINTKRFMKNRLSCTYCEFKKTADCP